MTGVSCNGSVVKLTLPVTPSDPLIKADPVKNKLVLFTKVKFPLPLNNPELLYCNELIGPFGGDPLPVDALIVTIPVPPVGEIDIFVPATI